MKRNILLLSFIILIALFTVGCSGKDNADVSATEKENKKAIKNIGDYNIQLSGDIEETEELFIVEGKSNLIPGSRLVGELVVDDGETVFSDTTELVEDDGSFYMELDHHKYGEAEIFIRFDFDGVQDDEVKRHYGEKGQNLEGPFIYKHKTFDGILNKAEAHITYNPQGENNLVIKAPNWYELPDDYGDPRIWIEVEELTEDGEYFYVHGRSNILEGSEIKIDYKGNRDKTQVKPDGSFDFKLDYEYLEDTDFVITFNPASFQWNEIEEAYGATGQKLVGNLVVSDKFSTDKQYIEKIIPLDGETNSEQHNDQDDENIENDENENKSDD